MFWNWVIYFNIGIWLFIQKNLLSTCRSILLKHGISCIPFNKVNHPCKQDTGSFIDWLQVLYTQLAIILILTSGVSYFWKLFRIIITLFTCFCLIFVGSSRTSSILNVIDESISLARTQLGDIQPLRRQIIFNTFSTKWCGLTILRSSMIWAFVNFLICTYVACTA